MRGKHRTKTLEVFVSRGWAKNMGRHFSKLQPSWLRMDKLQPNKSRHSPFRGSASEDYLNNLFATMVGALLVLTMEGALLLTMNYFNFQHIEPFSAV